MKKLILSMIAIAAMASCTTTSEDEFDPNAPVEINFGASIQSLSRAALSTGSAFNAYVVRQDAEESTAPTFTGLTPIAANVGTDGTVEIATQYYDATDKTSYFIGFTADKRKTGDTGTDRATVMYEDLDGQTDIMATNRISAGKKSSPIQKVELPYNHLLSQLQFQFKAGTNFPSGIEVTELSITDVKDTATLTLGEIPSLSFTGIANSTYTVFTGKKYAITSTGEGTKAAESVLVEAGLSSYNVKVVAGGITYTSKVTIDNNTSASKAHVITLTFLPSNVAFGSATIGQWDNGDNGSGEVK